MIHRKKCRPEKYLPEDKSKEELAKELADVLGMLIVSAHLLDIDLGDAIDKKWISKEKNVIKNKSMKITPYSDKYKEPVAELIQDILENEFGHHSKSGRPDLYKILEIYQKDKGNFWIAVEKEDVVGTIGLSDCGNGMGYLERMYVLKELRKKGIGSKLLSTLLKFATNNGYKKIFLSTWDSAVSANNFYIKNGFKRIKSLPKVLFGRSSNDNVFYKLEL